MDQDDLTERQVAARLKVSVRTLQNWRWLGIGPRYFKLTPGRGGRVRYRLADFQQWEQERVDDQQRGAA
ncbi:helix-turn-helix domain-containing protein [Streptomyces sp. NBC_00885]|uniref:helix-turn-helix transcriptional regulator n=1 Tax=Streptomyces sp. NBC_00885 TaxID=2975857 RepID=UPI003864DF22|nr:helix-turn-helix domain-containing protein [Streptomyces sp. NBC_00885]